MRATITLPEELHARLRRAAAEDGRTMSALVTDALRAALDERDARRVHPRPFRIRALSGGGGLRPGVDLDDSGGLADLMDR